MPRKSEEPLRKERLNLFAGDFEKMGILFPQLGAGPAIRILVRNFIRRSEATATKAAPVEVNLKELMTDD